MNRTKIINCYAGDTESYFTVIAETAEGRRLASFPNGTAPGMFPTLERAERFAARVDAAGSIDEQHWIELDPIYGSPAYEGQAFEAAAYAESLRSGAISEADVPDNLRTLL